MSSKKQVYRPFTDADLDDLCSHVASGKSLRSWCRDNERHDFSVVRWLRDDERQKLYREARRMQADAHIDELLDLADAEMPRDDDGRIDSGAVNQLRLRVDTRKWIASKYHPGLYGDRVAVDATFKPSDQPPDQILEQMVALLAANGLRVVPAEPESDGSGAPG